MERKSDREVHPKEDHAAAFRCSLRALLAPSSSVRPIRDKFFKEG